MRTPIIVLSTGVLFACQSTVPDATGEQAAAFSNVSASECNTAGTFVPPTLGLGDLGLILGEVSYYSDPTRNAITGLPNFQYLFTGSWTNWYRSDMDTGLAKLATMRGVLDKYNLYDTYLPGTRPQVDCSHVDTTVRQFDGTCNDLTNTTAGAVGARIGRNIALFKLTANGPVPNPAAYPAATDAELLTPNPRELSRALFTRGAGGTKEVPFLNMLAAAWIQFQVHDWFDHDNVTSTEMFRIPLASDDPLRANGMTEIVVPKTKRDETAFGPLPPVYHNLVTHWWDGSQMYGITKAQSDSLRAHDGSGHVLAEMAFGNDGLLPKAADGFEQTGMRKNWWLGLGVMHNLFAHEHNAVVAMLKSTHPEHAGNEDWYFSHARMITAAVIAKIHTVEWTPAILPNRTATVGLHANWYGLKSFLDPVSQVALPYFMQAAGAQIMNDPNPLLTAADKAERISAAKAAVLGVIGGETNNHGVPYSLTEEFTSVYRMHPLLPDSVSIYNVGDDRAHVYPTEQTRNAGARAIEEQYGMGNVVYSFGIQHPGALVLSNYPAFLQQLQLPHGVIDLGAIDILRDRERGLPRYNDFRQQLRLQRVASIEALTDDVALRAALHKVYGDDVGAIDRVDALVGTFGESTRPSCYGFGETLFQVFTEMASRRLQADRFYTSDFNAATYTAEGIRWVSDASMKAVLMRAYGNELQDSGLENVQNAFYPWK